MARLTVELMGKPGCHLCDDARVIVRSVLQDFPRAELVEHNILDDVEMFENFKNEIPVVLINGQRHSQWRVDEDSFRSALTKELA
ncbi:MAG: glutaredoxin family protein [Microbacteriaceae bacterium]|nr:glutaredoxin family protein [Microbacteriaceae bacterium]